MSKRHTVISHQCTQHVDHMDDMMRALATKKTPWKEDLYFPVKIA